MKSATQSAVLLSRRKAIMVALLAVALTSCVSRTALGGQRVVAYYPSWATNTYPHTKVDYSQLTHLAHAFVWPLTNGTLHVPNGFLYPQLVQAAHAHGVNIVVSLGGQNGSTKGFPAMANDPAARSNFVQQLTSFCVSNNYDGADIDWEYPGNEMDRTNLTLLVHELRAAFDAVNPGWTLSAAVGKTHARGQWLDVDQIKQSLDWFGVMTYNYHGPWSTHAGHHSPLYGSASDPHGLSYSTHGELEYYRSRGIPEEKLLLGIAFYGRQFIATNLYASSTGGDPVLYPAIRRDISNGWTRVWDNTSMVPYLRSPTNVPPRLITYSDEQSVQYKCEYVRSHGLGGVIIWALGQDLYQGQTPLLSVIGPNLLRATNHVVHGEAK